MTSPTIITLDIEGQTLQCHCTVELGEPAQTSGPPEHCHPGSPNTLEVNSVFLEHEIEDDLGLNAPPRKLEIDITALAYELGFIDELNERCDVAFDWGSLADDGEGEEGLPYVGDVL